MMVYYIGFSGIKQVGSCEFFLNRADSQGEPSPYERVDRAKPGTGVGRCKVGPGAAPLPALRGHLPPGEGREPSPGRGWQGGALTGVGRGKVGPGTAPLPPPAGGTFPQGKVRGFLPPAFLSVPRFFRSPPLRLPGNRTSVPVGGSGSGGGRWSGRRGHRCSPGSRAPR